MPALVAGIHVFISDAAEEERRGWPGRSPAMTVNGSSPASVGVTSVTYRPDRPRERFGLRGHTLQPAAASRQSLLPCASSWAFSGRATFKRADQGPINPWTQATELEKNSRFGLSDQSISLTGLIVTLNTGSVTAIIIALRFSSSC
jgi:hypothetical protein